MFDPLIGARWSLDSAGTGQPDPSREQEMADYAARCAARHLVVAAVELARDPNLSGDRAARFSLAESKFRALTDFDGINLNGAAATTAPSVLMADGSLVPMIDLLVGACQLFRFRLPHRSIDSELVYAAKELLSGLAWRFPEEKNAPIDTPGIPVSAPSGCFSPSHKPA